MFAALAPDIELLILARLIQGLGSGACIVLSRAMVPDLAEGDRAAKAFALLMTIQGVAPILAPVIGGLFWVLAGLAAVQLTVVVLVIRESRPKGERSPATVRGILGNYTYVLASRGYRGYLVTFAFGFTTMFCHIAASPFLMQEQLGLSVQAYASMFAVNGVGIISGSMLNNRLIGIVETHRILLIALGILVAASVALLIVVHVYPAVWHGEGWHGPVR